MTYIIMAAGEGKKMHPLTLKCPKTMYKLDNEITIIKRMVKQIRKFDDEAEIVVVVGFMSDSIEKELFMENVILIRNPFYKITKSAVSLWFASDYLNRDNVVLLNSDVVFSDRIMGDLICVDTDKPYVLVDKKSIIEDNYKVQIENGRVLLISQQITSPSAGYCSVIKLDCISARVTYDEIHKLINMDIYNQYFEDVITQMIFSDSFEIFSEDICHSEWVEINTVDELIKARMISNPALY